MFACLLDRLDGLLLTGSPSNVHPSQYGGEPSHPETLHDPERDATTLPLIREAVRRDLPILAICRGIQELNVALGGTLHQRVHELPGRLNHRSRKDSPDGPYGPAHSVALTPGGLLASLAGTNEMMVNSLHSQGIDRPGPMLRVEAVAPDGQIEAVSLPEARFVVGVQWHPEYKALENPFSKCSVCDVCPSLLLQLLREHKLRPARHDRIRVWFPRSACVFAVPDMQESMFVFSRPHPICIIRKRREPPNSL